MPEELTQLMASVEENDGTPFVLPFTHRSSSDFSYISAPSGPGLITSAPSQGALVPHGILDPSQQAFGSDPFAAAALMPTGTNSSGALPGRPNLPEDPIIPHNGFATIEEGEKAFFHLLRKAGVDPTWTWDQTMRTIITDPLYKALNTLAQKKAAWQKVCLPVLSSDYEAC